MELPEVLKAIRSTLQLTQAQLAQQLHIGYSAVNRMENGHTHPNHLTAVSLLRFAQERGVSEELLTQLEEALFDQENIAQVSPRIATPQGVLSALLEQVLDLRSPDGVLQLMDTRAICNCKELGVYAIGKAQIRQHLSRRFSLIPARFPYTISKLQVQQLDRRCALVSCTISAENSRIPSGHLHLNLQLSLLERKSGYKIINMLSYPQDSYAGPLSEDLDVAVEQARRTLLQSAVSGGLIGRYAEDGYPVFFVDQMMLHALGYSSQEEFLLASSGSLEPHIHPEDRSTVYSKTAQAIADGKDYEVRYRLQRKDGSYLWIVDRGMFVATESGRKLLISLCHDITAEKQKDAYLQLVAHCIPGAISMFRFTPEQKLELCYLSDSWETLTGYTPQEYLLQIDNPAFYGAVQGEWMQARETVRQAVQANLPFNLTARFIRKDGQVIWLNHRGNSGSQPLENGVFYSMFQDVTEAIEQKSALLLANQKYETLLAAMPGTLCIYQTGPQGGQLSYLNQAALTALGISHATPETLAQLDLRKFVHPDDLAGMLQSMTEMLHTGKCVAFTCRVYLKGGIRWLKVAASATEADAEGLRYIYASALDITDQVDMAQELLNSEAKYRIASQSAGIGVAEYDFPSQLLTVTVGSCSRQQKIAHLNDYLPSLQLREDSQRTAQTIQQSVEAGQSDIAVELWLRKEGSVDDACHQVICTVTRAKDGTPVKLYAASRDITAQKKLEDAFRSENNLYWLLNHSTMAAFKVNITQNKILEGSSQNEAYSQHVRSGTLDTLLFENLPLVVQEQDRQILQQRFSQNALQHAFMQGEKECSHTYLYRRPSGKTLWLSIRMSMVQDQAGGNVLGYLYIRDITREKTAELIAQKIALEKCEAVATIDSHPGTIVFYNHNAAPKLNGVTYRYEDALGFYAGKLLAPEERDRFLQQASLPTVRAALEEKPDYELITSTHDLQENPISLLWSYRYLNREAGLILQTIADITGILQQENQQKAALRAAAETAHRANEAKSLFLAKMSHELRTPLNAIMGSASLARENSADAASVREWASNNISACRYLLTLINDLLDLTRAERDEIVLCAKPLDCAEMVQEMDVLLRSSAEQAGICYDFTQEPSYQDDYLGDPIRIKQILLNLLSNAIKFTPSGGSVHLIAREISRADGHAHVQWVVSDTGIGIASQFLERIFQPFEQEHDGSTTDYGGTGLGLPIARKLARMMDGDIRVESTVGGGTTFTVDLTLGIGAHLPKPIQVPDVDTALLGKRILLAEDHPLNVLIEKRILLAKGMEVDHAENGQVAVDKFRSAPSGTYDAILMDIRMPVMDGLEAAQQIRALSLPEAKTIPIIAATANAYAEDIQQAMEAGMNAHLAKPIEPQTLYTLLSQLLH